MGVTIVEKEVDAMLVTKAPRKTLHFLQSARRRLHRMTRRKTVIGAGHRILGDINGSGDLEIHGEYDGTLRVEGRVVIGESARFAGALIARRVVVGGIVEGEVSAWERVTLLSSSRMKGDIRGRAVAIEPGAVYGGNVNMASEPPSVTAEYRRSTTSPELDRVSTACGR